MLSKSVKSPCMTSYALMSVALAKVIVEKPKNKGISVSLHIQHYIATRRLDTPYQAEKISGH
jgi:hypothetical protein